MVFNHRYFTPALRGVKIRSKKFLFIGLVLLTGVWLTNPFYTAGANPETEYSVAYFTPQSLYGWDEVVITFSEPLVDDALLYTELSSQAIQVTPGVPGNARWLARDKIGFFFDAPLAPSQEYTVELAAELRPPFVLTGQRQFTFTTERFEVQRATLKLHYDKGLQKAKATGRFTFNYPINIVDFREKVSIVDGTAAEIPYILQTPSTIAQTFTIEVEDVSRILDGQHFQLQLDKGFQCLGMQTGLEQTRLTPIEVADELPFFEVNSVEVSTRDRVPNITLLFNANGRITPAHVQEYVSIEPPVAALSIRAFHGSLDIYGNFKPRATYTVSIKRGLTSEGGLMLKEDYAATLTIPDLEPQLRFPEKSFLLPRKGPLTLDVATINVERVSLAITKLFLADLPRLIHMGVLHIESPRNEEIITTLPLKDYLTGEGGGIFKVVPLDAGHGENVEQVILVTDLGIVAKTAGDELWVWVNSLDSLRPVSQATVKLIGTRQGGIPDELLGTLHTAITDAEGFVKIPLVSGQSHKTPTKQGQMPSLNKYSGLILTVAKGDDFSFLRVDRDHILTGNFSTSVDEWVSAPQSGGKYPFPNLKEGYEAFLYTNSGVYRPGEKVNLVGIVRAQQTAPDNEIPASLPIWVDVRTPGNQTLRAFQGQTDQDGACEVQIQLPASAQTGMYSATMWANEKHRSFTTIENSGKLGQVSFQVEEFMPDRMKVTVETDKATYMLDDEVNVKVSAVNLFGAPASGLKVDATCRLVTTSYVPTEKWRSFNFSDSPRPFESESIGLGETRTDAEGKAAYQFKPKVFTPLGGADTTHDTAKPTSPLNGVISVTAQELGGRAVTASQHISIHPYSHYIGIQRQTAGTVKPNEEVGFNYIVVDKEGTAEAGRAVEFTLYAIAGTQTTQLETHTLTSTSEKGHFTFTPSLRGEHRVEGTDVASGSKASVRFYVSEWGGAPWSKENSVQLDLTLDKAAYQPGETAALHIKAPFPGKLLLTIEREKVLGYQTLMMKEPTATVAIPFKHAYRPNVYLYATLIRPLASVEKDEPARAFGIVPLKLDAEPNRLAVALDMPEQIRPDREVEIKFHVRGNRREGQPYRVSIAAVDEGIVQLTDFQTPALHAYFYRQRRLETRSYEFYTAITRNNHFPIRPIESFSDVEDLLLFSDVMYLLESGFAPTLGRRNGSSADFGGGFGASGSVPPVLKASMPPGRLNTSSVIRVKPVTRWSGLMTTDSDGRGVVRFKIPQFNGTLRVMAVAFSGEAYGSATQQIEVSEPLILTPTFPRFLSGGDRLRVPVSVFNNTGTAGDFTVELQATGPVQLLTEVEITNPSYRDRKSGLQIPPTQIEGDFGKLVPVPPTASVQKQVRVATGATEHLFFDVLAHDAIGVLTFNLSASGNDETTQRAVQFPLRPAAPPITKSGQGVVLAGEPTDFVLPSNLLADSSEFTLTVAPFPAVKFGSGLRYLIRYPHGCLEQTTSRVFALLYLSDIAKLVEPTLIDAAGQRSRINHYITAGITKLEGMLLPTHHFAYWPNGTSINAWSSVYAAHFLVEARKAGYELSDTVYNRMLEGLRHRAKAAARFTASDKPDRYKVAQAVYACYVLATAGQPEKRMIHYLKDNWLDELNDYSRFQLAGAFALIGEQQKALSLLPASIALNAANQRETGRNFDSPVRAHAIMLDVLAEVAENHPAIPALVESLTEAASEDGRWATTQENAFALLALGKMLKRHASGQYTGRLTLNGTPFADFDATGAQYTARDWDGARVQLTVEGQGSCYYYWTAFGVGRDSYIEEYERDLQISRRYVNQDGIKVGPVFQSGEVVVAEITVKALSRTLENVVVVDMLPAGFEIENPRLQSRASLPWMQEQSFTPDHMDIRDDRLIFFGNFPHQRERKFYYMLRAVTPGIFTVPPVSAEAMYNPESAAVASSGTIEVVE